jgi:hypothetical protein
MDVANVSNTVTIVIIVATSIAYIINVHNYYKKKVATSITNVSMSVTIEYFLCNPGITQRVCNPLKFLKLVYFLYYSLLEST